MNFLILGGNGYLGAKVTKALIDINANVVCTIRKKSDLSRLKDYLSNVRLIPASLEAIETVLQYEKFDWVLNFACNYGRSEDLYDNVIESNIAFPLATLNAAVGHEIKNYLTIGTGLPDTYNMYSFSKKKFSEFGKYYVDKHKINFVNLKLQMFYGADEPEDRFIPMCIHKMLRNDIVDLTEGTQKRDIVSIDDVVDLVTYVIGQKLTGYYEIEVGCGEAPSIREIIEYIYSVTQSKSELRWGAVPMRAGEPDCLADISRMKEIGYSCKKDWKTGLADMIKEIKKNENIN